MKNYYEILEVDRKASPEVIDKAYRTLVKKYHPDLQNENNKNLYAEKMKEINEAYDVLSNDYKKTTYDEQLSNLNISEKEYERIIRENSELKEKLEKTNIQKNEESQEPPMRTGDTIFNMGRVLNNTIKNVYKDISERNKVITKKGNNYKARNKHDISYYTKILGGILIIIFVCFLIYQIPPIKIYFTRLYNNNIIFKAVIDIFKNTIESSF